VILLIRVINLVLRRLSTANEDFCDLEFDNRMKYHPIIILFCKWQPD